MNKKFFDASIIIFCFLLIISTIGTFFANLASIKIIGLLGLAWSLLAFLMFLWLYERLYYYKKQIKPAKDNGLSHKLITSMQNQRIYNYGMKALRAHNPANFFILGSGVFYILWQIFEPAGTMQSAKLIQLHTIITDFFVDAELLESSSIEFLSILSIIQNSVIIGIVFFIYWLAQIYVYGSSRAESLFWLALSLFCVAFFLLISLNSGLSVPVITDDLLTGYQWHNLETLQKLGVIPQGNLSYFQLRLYAVGLSGALIFYIPGFIITLILIRNLFSRSLDKRMCFCGLMVLLVLLCTDLFYAANIKQFSLWVSGWCLLGVTSIRAKSGMRKIYKLHQ